MDEAARRLDRDPVELRRQNLLAHGEEFAPGDTPIDGKFEESLSRAAEAIGWTQALAADRGRGVAMMIKASIAPSVSEAIVRLHADGSVTVLASTVELGQGARTVMAQIAAEVLASAARARRASLRPDTDVTPYDQTTSSSRSTTMVGKAVEQAAGDVAEQLVRIAARTARRASGRAPARRRRRLSRRPLSRLQRAAASALRHGRRRADRPRRGGAGAERRPAGGQHAVLGDGGWRRRGARSTPRPAR